MGKPGPSLGLEEYLQWQHKLEDQQQSGLSVTQYCLQHGGSRATFYRWIQRLKEGIPKQILHAQQPIQQHLEDCSLFVPIDLPNQNEQTDSIHIELPNGSLLQLPLGLDRAFLLEILRTVNELPNRSDNS